MSERFGVGAEAGELKERLAVLERILLESRPQGFLQGRPVWKVSLLCAVLLLALVAPWPWLWYVSGMLTTESGRELCSGGYATRRPPPHLKLPIRFSLLASPELGSHHERGRRLVSNEPRRAIVVHVGWSHLQPRCKCSLSLLAGETYSCQRRIVPAYHPPDNQLVDTLEVIGNNDAEHFCTLWLRPERSGRHGPPKVPSGLQRPKSNVSP